MAETAMGERASPPPESGWRLSPEVSEAWQAQKAKKVRLLFYITSVKRLPYGCNLPNLANS